ncbi:SchA/CurD-like domain-containing protein [Actinacidiphila oryziradicis]|uniref:SchA/CurD-like domain-containing protein n=1 Tax=Actinacidiphila oryziradicis TaxID=2571141 RepID=UPI001B7FFBA2|nr:SchA/CurD-like domain-containing protein [Actinacidiphila oryziradicis]
MSEPCLLAWSAPDERAETRLRQWICDHLARHPGDPDGLVALVEQHQDTGHAFRAAVVLAGAGAVADAVAAVRGAPVRRLPEHRPPRPVALLLDGHGAQHVRMGAQLYGVEPVFTDWMDDMFGLLGAEGDALRADWLAEQPVVPLDAAERGQPLLFALGHALGRTVLSWGVRPTALLGHSVGELAAAALSGVFGLPDAASLMTARTASYRDAAPGGLLAVAASLEQVAEFLGDGVCVGVVNGPNQTMLAGSESALEIAARRLREAGYTALRARIPLPFHSPVLAPLAAVSEAVLARIQLRPPRIDVFSTITARRLRPEEAVDPAFWASQVCRPVLFGPALDELLAEQDVLLVEAGPARALANLARRHPAVVAGRSAVTAMLPPRLGVPGADRRAVLETVAAVWLEGHRLDWTAVSVRGAASSVRGNRRTIRSVGDTFTARKYSLSRSPELNSRNSAPCFSVTSPGGVMQRYAVTFRVRPGTEEDVANLLATYDPPNPEIDDETRLLSTSVFMKDQQIVRMIEFEGDFVKIMAHLSQDPNIQYVEHELDKYLIEEDRRDMSNPQGAKEFFMRAMMRTVTTRVPEGYGAVKKS